MNAKQYMGLLTALVVVAGHAGKAHAQAAETEQRPDPIDLSVLFRGEYTDNRDATENDKESTFDAYVGPRIDVRMVIDPQRTSLVGHYQPMFRYRSNPSDIQNEEEFQHDLGLDFDHRITSLTALNLHELFTLTDDPSIEEGGSTIRANRSYFKNKAGGALKWDASRHSWMRAQADYELKRYDDSQVAATSDEDILDTGVTVWRRVNRSVAGRGDVGFTQYKLESEGDINRDVDVVTGSAGIETMLNRQCVADVRLGLQNASYKDASLGDTVVPYASAGINYAAAKDRRMNANLAHGLRKSDVYPFASQEYTDLRARGEVDLSSLLTLGGGATYRISQYDSDARPEAAPTTGFKALEGDETLIAVSVDATWKIKDGVRFRLAQRMEDINSDVDVSFTKNTSIAELQADF